MSPLLQLAKGAVAAAASFSLPPYDPDETGDPSGGGGGGGGTAVLDLKELPDNFEEKWKKGEYMFKG